MKYIDPVPNASGAYPAAKNQPFPGCVPLTDEQAKMFRQYNGFVTVTQETDESGAVSVTVEPNTEAWEAWKESLPPEPEPEPSVEERVTNLETAIANGLNLYEGDLGNA